MPVSVNTERKLVEVRWDPGSTEGNVTVFAYGEADDVHNTAEFPNDGLAALSYPYDFQGSSYIEVKDAEGNVIDQGEIQV